MVTGGAEIDRLIGIFAKLPGLGPRSARRIVLKLLAERQGRLVPLIDALRAASEFVRTCAVCGTLDAQDPCHICADPDREPIICVVETVADLWALDRAAGYRGRYHVLGGTLSAIAGRGPEQINIASLLSRLSSGQVSELILALPATIDGATTAHYLLDRLARYNIPVSRLAQGVPIGGALEILDDGTLAAAMKSRRAM
ncbi:MAG: recombination protein RecR [Rhodospirillales bacterium 20-60-12]|jgi:recombination protein RecR|nr:MAG: recombination protein RecR [Rhodospirillales bacterium 20-60-12]HQT68150.1 recombination mediator RecR [Acetobacteraceae bacterium]